MDSSQTLAISHPPEVPLENLKYDYAGRQPIPARPDFHRLDRQPCGLHPDPGSASSWVLKAAPSKSGTLAPHRVTGPRQAGKTYPARQLTEAFQRPVYLNCDDLDDRRIIMQRTWRTSSDLLVFDEIHKMKDWKNYLKGVHDSRSEGQSILVTGSARLETYRQSGESLASRHLLLRLNPLSVHELKDAMPPFAAVERLNTLGGFPEPFLSGLEEADPHAEESAARWRNQYHTDLIREDILEFSRIREIKTMKQLVEILLSRVGGPLSYKASLRICRCHLIP